jgi:hypothetical protein
MVLENIYVDFPLYLFLKIYNKFVKFLKDLTNISITLKILIHENYLQHPSINIGPISRVVFKYQELTKKFLKLFSIFINFN